MFNSLLNPVVGSNSKVLTVTHAEEGEYSVKSYQLDPFDMDLLFRDTSLLINFMDSVKFSFYYGSRAQFTWLKNPSLDKASYTIRLLEK